jgi:hypothetical protein
LANVVIFLAVSLPAEVNVLKAADQAKGRKVHAAKSDPFVGTFIHEQATITFARAGSGYRGAFIRMAQQAPIQAVRQGEGLSGTIQDTDGTTYLFQLVAKDGGVILTLNGQQYFLAREGGRPASSAGVASKGSGGPGSIGKTNQDRQLAQLLLSSRWCHFTYKSSGVYTGGSSYQETVTFTRDGIVTVSSGSETSSSGWGGSYAGSNQSGPQRMYCRTHGGYLNISADGVTWAVQPLTVKRNSSGYPIITSGGKEYSMCQ